MSVLPHNIFSHINNKPIGFSVSGKCPPSFSKSPSHESLAVGPQPRSSSSPRSWPAPEPIHTAVHVSLTTSGLASSLPRPWPPCPGRPGKQLPDPPSSHSTQPCVRLARANHELIAAPGPPRPPCGPAMGEALPCTQQSLWAHLTLPKPCHCTPLYPGPQLPPQMATSSQTTNQDSRESPDGLHSSTQPASTAT